MRGSHFRGVGSCPQSTPSLLVGLATNGSPGKAGFCRERLFASRLKEAKGIILGLMALMRQGESPGGEDGTPLQYSCLENSTDRGA